MSLEKEICGFLVSLFILAKCFGQKYMKTYSQISFIAVNQIGNFRSLSLLQPTYIQKILLLKFYEKIIKNYSKLTNWWLYRNAIAPFNLIISLV